MVVKRLARWARAGILLVAAAAGCQTTPNGNAVLKLRNDTTTRIVVAGCEDFHCQRLGGSVRDHLAPGSSLPVSVSADGVVSYYRMTPESGGAAKCLSLTVTGAPNDRVVPVSAGVDCTERARAQWPSAVVVAERAGGSAWDGVIGWAFYLLVVAVGATSTVAATVWAHRRLRDRPLHGPALAWSTIGAAFAAFLGLWVAFDLYWLSTRLLSKRPSATTA